MKIFTKNDDGFACKNCGKSVPPLGYTSRNHCPFCLWSLHVDISPGDRANGCAGLMEPVSLDPKGKKGAVIIHRCASCGEVRRNLSARDDDGGLLIKLSAKPL